LENSCLRPLKNSIFYTVDAKLAGVGGFSLNHNNTIVTGIKVAKNSNISNTMN
jgi:hypothetical protein